MFLRMLPPPLEFNDARTEMQYEPNVLACWCSAVHTYRPHAYAPERMARFGTAVMNTVQYRTESLCCRGLVQSIHDYQRHGGLTRQFEQIDRAVSDFLVSGESTSHRQDQLPTVSEHHEEAQSLEHQRSRPSNSSHHTINGS